MEKCETKTVKCGCSKKCKAKGFDSVLGAGAGLEPGNLKGTGAGFDFGDELEAVKKMSIKELIRNINYSNSLIKGLKADLEAYKKELIELMKCKGIDKYMSKSVSVSYIPSSVSYVFNVREFKEMRGDIYQEFLTKRKEVGESVRVSERK